MAFAGPTDSFHARAVERSENWLGRIITTDYVRVQTGGMLSRPEDRPAFLNLVRDLKSDPAVQIVPASKSLFRAGFELFARRTDKDGSFVDSISFVVMNERKLTDALTTDHHFQQAGFNALLREH